MRRHTSRGGHAAVLMLIASTVLAVPAQADSPQLPRRSALSEAMTKASLKAAARLSPPAAARRQQAAGTAAPAPASSFFKSRKGAIVIGLMAAGTGFTFWSITHDRTPVKSPIR